MYLRKPLSVSNMHFFSQITRQGNSECKYLLFIKDSSKIKTKPEIT